MRRATRDAVIIGAVAGSRAATRPATVVVAPYPPPAVAVYPPRPAQTVVVTDPGAAYYPPDGMPPVDPLAYPAGNPPQQPGYPPQQPGYPPQQPGYPPQQPGYPPTQPNLPPSGAGYPPPQPGQPPAGYPPQQIPPANAYPPPAGYIPPPGPAVAYPPGPAVVAADAAAVSGLAAGVRAVQLEEKRLFYVVNESNCSVLDAGVKVNPKPGCNVLVDKRKPSRAEHQLWYADLEGIIHCAVTGFALECKDIGDRVRMVPYTGDVRQQWIIQGNKIVNKVFCNECISLKKLLRVREDADVIKANYEGKPWQHWRVEYVK